MILSYHPCFQGDHNLICAGRDPDEDDLAVIRQARAVILPQGCRERLYQMVSENSPNIFPNYDARFSYPDKIGQIKLFQRNTAPHPRTETFENIADYRSRYNKKGCALAETFPFVFKHAWGGGGFLVHRIDDEKSLKEALKRTVEFERSGYHGFLIQEYIECNSRSLRVVIVGWEVLSYWRVQKDKNIFHTNLTQGGHIDKESDPELQKNGVSFIKDFCRQTGINLAGFDLLFDSRDAFRAPLFLEINYFFGREGLGGSQAFYELLETEIRAWLKRRNL